MVRKLLILLLCIPLLFSACDLSGLTGTPQSVSFRNNSDSVVTISIGGQEYEIEPDSTSAIIQLENDVINSGEVELTLDGIYYYQSTRHYVLGRNEITLSPDCYWIRVKNGTEETITDLKVHLSYNENSYPRSTQNFEDAISTTVAAEEAVFIPMFEENPGKSLTLVFNANGTEASASNPDLNFESGKTTSLVLEESEDGNYPIVPWVEAEDTENTGV